MSNYWRRYGAGNRDNSDQSHRIDPGRCEKKAVNRKIQLGVSRTESGMLARKKRLKGQGAKGEGSGYRSLNGGEGKKGLPIEESLN